MNYGYVRASTADQTVAKQVAQLERHGVDRVVREKHPSKSAGRHQLRLLIGRVRQGDTITVATLSQLARSTGEALDLIKTLQGKRVSINVLNLGLINDTIVGRLTVRILQAVAEMENESIVARTQAGKTFAKAHNPNFREGRKPALSPDEIHQMLKLIDEEGKSQTQVAKILGVSQPTISRTYRTEKLSVQADAEEGLISPENAYDLLGEGGRAIVAQAQADGSWPVEDPVYDQMPADLADLPDDELPGFAERIKMSFDNLNKENSTQSQ